jgi:D-alanyl-D-alanine carboxypeptidase/D-alanyl-D-alanine-endopeptidase (penicillin-binding protein 4)
MIAFNRFGIQRVATLALALLGIFATDLTAKAADDAAPEMASLIRQQGFAAIDVGYILLDLGTGKAIDSAQADQPFVPGSVLKLATSLVAWQTLGPDFHFTTRLWRKGWALYLQGSGDPVLAATDLQALVRSLLELRAAANWQAFYVDATAIMPGLEISVRQPLAADYNPGFGALNVDFNRLVLAWPVPKTSDVKTVKPVSPFRITSEADGLTVPIDWMAPTPASSPLPSGVSFVLASPGSNQQPESWSYNPGLMGAALATPGALTLPVKQADPMTARIFRAIALGQNVNLPLPQSGAAPGDAMLVGQHDSPSLAEMLPRLLRYSNNLTAEMIGLTSSIRVSGKATTLADSAQQQMRWLSSHLPATDWQGFRMVNQSGLDGDNRATPRQIAEILQRMAADPALAACLPALKLKEGMVHQADIGASLLAGQPRISGKSGTMDYAAGLAGLVTTPGGRRLAYAIFITDDRQRAGLAAAFDPRVLQPAKEGRAWALRARHLEADLLQHWLAQLAAPAPQ